MTLQIDPETPKGQIQLETIRWSEEQINLILKKYFGDQYKIMKGLRIKFNLNENSNSNEEIKVSVTNVSPRNDEEMNNAINQVKGEFLPKGENK